MIPQSMVVGFTFSDDFKHVLLLRKTHSEWQKGLLNGVGGHREDKDMNSTATMRREFIEETRLDIADWKYVASLRSENWEVFVFCTVVPYDILQLAVENTRGMSERAEIVSINAISLLEKIVGNARFLIPMALDRLMNPNSFKQAVIEYE